MSLAKSPWLKLYTCAEFGELAWFNARKNEIWAFDDCLQKAYHIDNGGEIRFVFSGHRRVGSDPIAIGYKQVSLEFTDDTKATGEKLLIPIISRMLDLAFLGLGDDAGWLAAGPCRGYLTVEQREA